MGATQDPLPDIGDEKGGRGIGAAGRKPQGLLFGKQAPPIALGQGTDA